MAKKVSYNDIESIHEDWTLDERNGFPYSGKSVQEFIKKTLNGKGGEFYYDSDTTKYIVFADAESRDLYLSDRERYADLVIGSFDAPANYTAEINMITPSSNVVLSGTKGCYIDFTFDIKSKNGSSTGESVIATFTFNNAGNIKKVTQIYSAGTNVHFLADAYLDDGSNSVSVVITGRNTLVGAMAAVNYMMVALQFTSSFDFSRCIISGDYIGIPYYLEGAGVKYIEWYIDGVPLQDIDTISDLRVNRTKSIPTTGISIGKHSVQARAYITSGSENFYSKTLYFDFVVAPENESWQANTTFVLLGLTLDAPTSSSIAVTAEQYANFYYKAAVYDSRKRSVEMLVLDNGTQVQSVVMYANEPQSLSYFPSSSGMHVLTFVAEEDTAAISMDVVVGEIDIQETTDELILKLSAKGRSNNESNPGTWDYEHIHTTFNGFSSWNEQSGWVNDALVIPAGANINVGLAPLSSNAINTGRTIEIDYETVNVTDDSAEIMSIVNSETNAGLSLTASTAKLRSRGGTSVDTKYRDGDRVHLTFIINKTTGGDARMMYIVNNGILERAAQFAANDSFNAPGNIIIGSAGCAVRVYSIRVYNKALTVDEAFCNYAVDSHDLINVASNNDIYDRDSVNINVDKVNAHIPVMIITGNIDYILGINDKSHKNDWNTYPVQIEFRDMQNPERNFFLDNADIRLQGTSSISYPRKNFRIYSKSKSGKYQTKLYSPTHNAEDLIASGKYSFKPNAAAVSCWCLKADYAESSGSHNTGVAKFWNKRMYDTIMEDGSHPLRTMAQAWAVAHNYPYDVRTTIDGFPIVLFHRNDENAPLTCFGQYNFNNDKSTEDVFGFTALTVEDEQGHTESFDNSHVECWEVLDSDNSIALFTDVSDFDTKWSDAFEARYPDKNKNVVALKRVSEWINSCCTSISGGVMHLNMEKWRSEKAQYFDLPKLAAYYVYLLRFGAVDQTVKNAMFTTEDGEHWFYINYDNDTILGIDNASHLFDAWDYGLKTRTPSGGYYYAGKGMSVLWNLFEADNVDGENYKSCMTLAREIDELLFKAGMTYETICDMFDNEQSGKWCERIYNENGRYKYIEQALQGQNVLYMLQGSRKSHRHWWLQHRLEKYDNEFGNGTYTRRSIQARSTSQVNIPKGATYKFVPAISSKFGYGVASTVVDAPTAREAGTEYTSTGLPQATGVGNLIYIYNANNIHALDVSGYISAIAVLDVSAAVDANGNSWLRKLVLGDGVNENVYLSAISGLSAMKWLEEIDIRGYKAITSMELVNLPNLHKLYAGNSGLTSFATADGAVLTEVVLPNTIQSISLDKAVVNNLTYTANKTLTSLYIRNIQGSWDAKNFVNDWLALFTDEELENVDLTLIGINWTGMTVEQVLRFAKTGHHTLQGKVRVSSLTYEQYQEILEAFGENVFAPNGTFVIDAPAQVFIDGPSQIKEGKTGTFIATFFPVTEADVKYLLYNGSTLISPQTDQQGNVYRTYNGVTLYEATGVMSVGSISGQVNVKVRAQLDGTEEYSLYMDVSAVKITYPTSVNISGSSSVNQNGMYNYAKSLVGTYNADILSVEWNLSNNNAAVLYSSDANGAVVNVTNTPATSVNVTLSCVVTFEGGVTRTGTKTITIVLTFPSSITISGPANIDDNGDYAYTKAFNTNNFTAELLDVIWNITANEYVLISEQDESGATLKASNGNPTAMSLTLSCVAIFTGDVRVTGTKNISVSVFAPPAMEDWVDLGLPSGLLWCRHNVGGVNPEDAGLYFAWGETVGYADAAARNAALGSNLGFNPNNYQGGTITTDLTLEQDGAHATMGLDWRMPTKTECEELLNNTTKEEITIKGVVCVKFTSVANGNYIVFPKCGCYEGNTLHSNENNFHTSTIKSNNTRYSEMLDIRKLSIYSPSFYNGLGAPIRPVREAPKAIDLGLPSGTLWADRNVGATSPEETGLYFAWGETEGYKDAADRNAKLTAETGTTYTGGFDKTSYNRPGGASGISGNLTSANDAASKNLGGSWRMPTAEECQELIDNTNNTSVTINGVDYVKISNKNDENKYLLFPRLNAIYENSPMSNTWYIWTGSSYNRTGAKLLNIRGISMISNNSKCCGMQIRPIQ